MTNRKTIDSSRKSVGVLLQNYRKKQGYTQRTLAGKIHRSAEMVSAYERGRRIPPLDILNNLCNALALTVSEANQLRNLLVNEKTVNPSQSELVVSVLNSLSDEKIPIEQKDRLSRDLEKVHRSWLQAREKKIEWAIIPVAGWQAAVLANPQTADLVKVSIGEARQSGIHRFAIIVSRKQQDTVVPILKKHFPEDEFREVLQHEELGIGHAIQQTDGVIPENESVIVIFPDERLNPSCLKNIISLCNKHQQSILSLRKIEEGDEDIFGIASGCSPKSNGKTISIGSLEEKLYPQNATNKGKGVFRILGRYALTSEIYFELGKCAQNQRTGKFELTDALNALVGKRIVKGYLYSGKLKEISAYKRLIRNGFEDFMNGW